MVKCGLCEKEVVFRRSGYIGGIKKSYSQERKRQIPNKGAEEVAIYGCSDPQCDYELTEEDYLETENGFQGLNH